jgi:hypothetical protein
MSIILNINNTEHLLRLELTSRAGEALSNCSLHVNKVYVSYTRVSRTQILAARRDSGHVKKETFLFPIRWKLY